MTKPDPAAPHHIQARVYYEDTDAGGIIYHSNYFKFAERGRTEFMRALGYNHHQVQSDHHLMLVVRHADIDYRAPGRLDDLLDIATEMLEIGTTSLTMKQVVSRKDKVLAEINIVLVAVNESGKPTRIPPQLRQIFGR